MKETNQILVTPQTIKTKNPLFLQNTQEVGPAPQKWQIFPDKDNHAKTGQPSEN